MVSLVPAWIQCYNGHRVYKSPLEWKLTLFCKMYLWCSRQWMMFVLNRSPLFGTEETPQTMLSPRPSSTAPVSTTVLQAQLEHCKCGPGAFLFYSLDFWCVTKTEVSCLSTAMLGGLCYFPRARQSWTKGNINAINQGRSEWWFLILHNDFKVYTIRVLFCIMFALVSDMKVLKYSQGIYSHHFI